MSLLDSRGVPLSTSNHVLLQHYEHAVELSASYFLDPLATIEKALEEDPTFASGHCLRAGLAVMATDRNATPLLEESVRALEAPGARLNERERAHAAAARAWLEGDFAGSIRRYGDILLDYPQDLLALQIAHVGDFYLGQSTMLRDRIAQVLTAWDPCAPGYSYVLGMYAFGLEETALYSRAEDAGRRALELNPRDPWGVHAVAHVMEMQGRLRDGVEWLTSREQDWAVNNGFAFHNWWHLALFHLDAGDAQQALELCDRRIRPNPTQVPLEMIDAGALLWRLELQGVNVSQRWAELASAWEHFAEHAYYAFNDVHAVMAFVGARRFDLVQQCIAAMERAANGAGTNAMMTRDVGLPVAQALACFGMSQYEQAVELLIPVRTIASRFGGSHAQRDLLHLTLVEAALRAKRVRLARALIAERTQLKPSSPFNWGLTARVMEMAGDSAGALKARENAQARRRAQFGAHRAVA
ncbi:MAG TPA: tetratricopeptide repeat protein [Steroidobacter sp.]|jgi:tetratricopeptide (TPR) repeat protein|nr:tetratricopeptide repeat protein [Steroidobacteraceae bacterium]HLS82945.1 tetratricopeptide repeat protein [Steroidobacter sp.]